MNRAVIERKSEVDLKVQGFKRSMTDNSEPGGSTVGNPREIAAVQRFNRSTTAGAAAPDVPIVPTVPPLRDVQNVKLRSSWFNSSTVHNFEDCRRSMR